jgi:membrane protein implicated in regulation of membrane protease activity
LGKHKDSFEKAFGKIVLMKKNRPSFQIVLKYVLLQTPSLIFLILALIVLRQWFDFSAYLVVGFVGLWALKDAILFPFLWRYYDTDQFPDRFAMVNRTGLTISRLEPDGYVQVGCERWCARIAETGKPIEKGKCIRVKNIEGLKLTVEPSTECNRISYES